MFQFVSILLLIIYLFEAVNFSTNFEKHCCIFEKKNKKIFEKSKMAIKKQTCCKTAVAMASIFNSNMIAVMKYINKLDRLRATVWEIVGEGSK